MLVYTAGHYTIRGVERLLDAVAVVAVNVDVEHARVGAQKLENTEDDIINVAEPGGFALFGVVQPASPVDGDVGCAGC